MSTDGQERPSAARPEDLLEFEILISDLSSRFINLLPGEVDHEIEDALHRVCVALGIDFAALWQWSAIDPEALVPTHTFPAGIARSERGPGTQEQYPWTVREMLAGRTIALASLDDAPPEAAVDVASARLAGIRSNLTLPFAVGGEAPIGAMALNTVRTERDWPEALVRRLRLVAQVFANALARQRTDRALRESEEVNRGTFEQMALGIAHVGADGRWLRVNDRLCEIVGYPREELLRRTFQDITHPDDLETDLEQARRLLAGSIRTSSMEKRYLRRDGSPVWAHLTVSLVRGEDGEPRHFISVVEDISERMLGEEALRTSRARLAAGSDLAGLAFYEVDFSTGTMYFEDRLRDLCGIPPDREPGLQPLEFWLEHLHPDDRARILDLRQRLDDGRLERSSLEYRYLHPTRGERWIQHLSGVASRDPGGRRVRTYGVLRDITERRRLEEERRDLSRRLIQAQEEERALLARELHDDLTQRLAVLAIETGRAELAAADGAQAQAMRSVREGLVRLSEDVHSLACQLHPSVLEELGLAEALRAECERLGRHGRIDLSLDLAPLPEAVGRSEALCLFRVAQEGLNNMIRHAHASAATLALREQHGGLLLAVQDDGVGFDPGSPGTRRSLGLASMHERVRLVGGTLEIESAPGRGTSIIAWVPLAGEAR